MVGGASYFAFLLICLVGNAVSNTCPVGTQRIISSDYSGFKLPLANFMSETNSIIMFSGTGFSTISLFASTDTGFFVDYPIKLQSSITVNKITLKLLVSTVTGYIPDYPDFSNYFVSARIISDPPGALLLGNPDVNLLVDVKPAWMVVGKLVHDFILSTPSWVLPAGNYRLVWRFKWLNPPVSPQGLSIMYNAYPSNPIIGSFASGAYKRTDANVITALYTNANSASFTINQAESCSPCICAANQRIVNPCQGTVEDPHTCVACSGSCDEGTYLAMQCSGTSTSEDFVCVACPETVLDCASYQCTATPGSSLCVQCNPGYYLLGNRCIPCYFNDANGAYVCHAGTYIAGVRCTGKTTSNTQFCTKCMNGGDAFVCEPGYFKSGVACTGQTTSDTQACSLCKNGGRVYACPLGFYESGSFCDGTTTVDTQDCTECPGGSVYDCGIGKRRIDSNGCLGGVPNPQMCTDCSNGGQTYTCPAGTHKVKVCSGLGVEDTQQCLPCGFGGALFSCPRGYRSTGKACDGTSFVDTQTCEECSNGGATYRCPDGSFQNGQICTGGSANNPDTQACTSCGPYACVQGTYKAGQVCSGLNTVNTQTCNECSYGFNYDCGLGFYRTGTACDGAGWANSQTCKPCANGGSDYKCPVGSFKTGNACSGMGDADSQTCRVCENGGASYACGSGYFKQGALCDGNGIEDTQTCSPCVNYCSVGHILIGVACDGMGTSDTRQCKECSNGGANYQCPTGFYKSGKKCSLTGVDSEDRQTCTSCSNGGAAYTCPVGSYPSGTGCDGTGSVDTQLCTPCQNGGASYACPVGFFKTGRACGTLPQDTQTCSPCSFSAAYDCGAGHYRSGAICSGTGITDTQQCSPCSRCPAGTYIKANTQCTGTTTSEPTCMACQNGGANYACPVNYQISGSPCTGSSIVDTQTCEAVENPQEDKLCVKYGCNTYSGDVKCVEADGTRTCTCTSSHLRGSEKNQQVIEGDDIFVGCDGVCDDFSDSETRSMINNDQTIFVGTWMTRFSYVTSVDRLHLSEFSLTCGLRTKGTVQSPLIERDVKIFFSEFFCVHPNLVTVTVTNATVTERKRQPTSFSISVEVTDTDPPTSLAVSVSASFFLTLIISLIGLTH